MTAMVSFEDSVKQRMKTIVADLIPEERWSQIVSDTVRDFERNDLPRLVKAELEAQYKKSIAAEFAKDEWQQTWSDSGAGASPVVRKLLVDAAPEVLASMFGDAMQNVMQQMRYAIENNRVY